MLIFEINVYMKNLNPVIYIRSFADFTENLIPAPKVFPCKELGVMTVCSGNENLSGFFPWDLPVVEISPEWVTGQSRASPVAVFLPLASGPACLGMAFPPLKIPLKRLLDTRDQNGATRSPAP